MNKVAERLVLVVLLVASPILFVLGIVLPLMTFEKLIFFEENPSLIGIVSALVDGGDYGLALLVGLFSIVFPVVKLGGIAFEALAPAGTGPSILSRIMPFLSKWSMMDVMLVAIVIAAAKTSGLANAFSEPGLWFYAGSAFMTSLAQGLIARRAGNPG